MGDNNYTSLYVGVVLAVTGLVIVLFWAGMI